MNTFHGHVTDVAQETRGSEVTVDLALGASTDLSVADLADFDENGGQVLVNGEVLTYTGTFGDDESDDQGLVLSVANTVAVLEGDRVDVWNPATSDVVSEWVATVADDLDGSAIQAPLTHALIDMLGTGVRGIVGDSVACEVDETDQWTVTEILGKTPTVDLGFADPTTVPPYAPSEKPATSPAITAIGMPDSFLLRTDSIDATTTLQYQTSPDAGTTWFDIGGPVASEILTAKVYGPDDTLFALNTDYVFRVQADNIAPGTPPAPSAATAPVQLDPSRVTLIASEVVTSELNADRALVGELTIGGPAFTLMPPGLHPDEPELNKGGLRIITTTGAVIHFPADGSAPVLKGLDTVEVENLDATNLDVQGASTITGSFTMGATIPDPIAAPTAESDYLTFSPNVSKSGVVGFCRTIADDGWVYLSSTTKSLYEVNDAGATVKVADFSNRFFSPQGITRLPEGGPMTGYLVVDVQDDDYVEVHHVNTSMTVVGLFDILFGIVTGIESATIGLEVGGGYTLAFETSTSTIVRRYDATAGLLGQVTLSGVTGDLGGVYYGPGDFGGNRYVVQQRNADPKVYDVNVPQAGEAWPRHNSSIQQRGLWWDGTYFWTVTSGGRAIRYETASATPAATYGFSYDWRDADTHHTGPSPEKTFTRPKRARIKVTATVAPQVGAAGTHIADRVQIYAATPNGGTKRPQGTALAAGNVAATLTTVGTTGTAASANNWSGVAEVGYLDAAVGGFKVDGNSNGSVGTGTFRNSVWTGLAYSERNRTGSTQSIPHNTFTTIASLDVETNGITYVSGGSFTVTQAGLYLLTAHVPFASNATGRRVVRWTKNGGAIESVESPLVPGQATQVRVTATVRCAVGDTLEAQAFQTSGAGLNIETSTRLTITQLTKTA